MTSNDTETLSSRSRLLAAGKTLFSSQGYEQTSTSSIAREAGSSESQLIRYFGGKAGLLEAVFNEAWAPLNEMIRAHVTEARHGREAIARILVLIIEAFSRDHEIAFLFLFEGRRVRGSHHDVVLSQGFQQFYELLKSLVRRGQEDGSFRNDVGTVVLVSAMLGAAEGMIRDRLVAERAKLPNPFEDAEIRTVFNAVVNALATTPPA